MINLREKLLQIVGKDYFSDDPDVLKQYSRDFSILPPGMPNYIVKPKDAQEISKVIKLANENLIPVVPVSSDVHFNGATIPKQGGIVLDLTRLDKILDVDEDNRRVRIEAGVTWKKIKEELERKGFRMIMPLLPHAKRSVVTDYLEREVPTNTVYDYGEPLQSMEVVWPNGEIFRTGSASVNGYPDSISRGANPSGPGIDFYRFIQGAQGTMGVVTWANLKIESIPKKDKVFFAPVYNLPYAIEFLYRILPRRIGQECVLLNNVSLASIITEDIRKDFEKFRNLLPPWTLILVISGLLRRPEEKIAYEEKALSEIIKNEFKDISLVDNLPGFPRLGKRMIYFLRNPWPEEEVYWKNRWKGGCQSLFFITRPVLAANFIKKVEEILPRFDYSIKDLGIYIQPIEHNRACHLEFHFFYDPTSKIECNKIINLYNETAKILLNEGAFFTRPYGEIAKLIYEKAASYTITLRRVKNIFDPNNIMNPGNLCF